MQTNQSWQQEDSKIAPVELPSLPDSLTSETSGSIAYSTKDAEQETENKTVSNTHVTLAEACAETSYVDDNDGAHDQQ